MTENSKNIITRPPVVVVLGHVDHGKSSLLEAIRKDLKITTKESGGITQHIGAYEAEWQDRKITFIDTPGHEAFSQMRSRGAKVADIAILVVDAAEGIKEQTKEAISHIKSAGISVIVALNKIDKPGANPEIVKNQLSKLDILVESLGGKAPSVETSAITSQGINELLDLILLMAELENFKADISVSPSGVVIESYLDKLKGPLATLLVLSGILRKNDIVATASVLGKIKNLFNFKGEIVEDAYPSTPVLVLGFEKTPCIGEEFKVFSAWEGAKSFATPLIKEEEKQEKKELKEPEKQAKKEKALNIILKTDCFGSLEAIKESIEKFPQENVSLKIIKEEAGNINESDIKLAQSTSAVIIGFRVGVEKIAKELSLSRKIKIRTFDVIYELFQEIKKMMDRLLEPKIVREDLGKFKVSIIFKTEKRRQIIGGKVIEGRIEKGSKIEVYRGENKVGSGRLVGLQIEKKNVDVVEKGKECGILYEGETRIEEGDILSFFKEKREKLFNEKSH